MSLTPGQLQQWFAAGPVLLLCDGDHPGHRGLPQRASGKVVVVQLAGQSDLDRLMLPEPSLTVHYGTDDGDCDAILDRAGVFGLAGRQGDSTQVVLRQAPPALLGPSPPLALQQILAAVGLTALDGEAATTTQAAPALLLLAPPQQMTPRQAVQWAMRHGMGLVLVDGLAPAVMVPSGLQTQPVVAIPVGMPWVQSELDLDDEGLSAVIPNGQGEQAQVRAPWTAVISVNSLGGAVHGSWNWPDHPSPGLRYAMAAQARKGGEEAQDAPAPDGEAAEAENPNSAAQFWHGSNLPVEAGADAAEAQHGEWVLQFDQPIGPAQAWGVPMLHVEYRLARRAVN